MRILSKNYYEMVESLDLLFYRVPNDRSLNFLSLFPLVQGRRFRIFLSLELVQKTSFSERKFQS